MSNDTTRTTPRTRRAAALSVAAAAALLAVTACSGGSDAAEDGDVTLRFTWWGAEHRNAVTEEVIARYEEQNPGVTIEAENSPWEGYWDRLATQSAGDDAPDVIQMDASYLSEYSERGALLDMDQVDVSSFDDNAVQNGTTDDGLVGVTTGINTMTVLANPELFEQAGMEMPDDESWTWDDYLELTSELREELPEEVYGDGGVPQTADLQIWLRQQGKHLADGDGELGHSVADLEEYFEYQQDLLEADSYPSATVMQEVSGMAPGESPFETGDQAVGRWWSNQVPALSEQAAADFEPLRYPSQSGSSEDNGLWFKSTMMYSVSAATEHPEEAQAFVDFLVNDEEAAEIIGMDRGLPASEGAREVVLDQIDGQEQVVADFIDEVSDEIGEAEPVPPVGFSQLQDIAYRYCNEVFFGRLTPAEAAEQMHAEMQEALDRG